MLAELTFSFARKDVNKLIVKAWKQHMSHEKG